MIKVGLFYFSLLWLPGFAQEIIPGTSSLHFQVETKSDPIDYLKIGTDTTSPKPVLLFLQGSLPIPLVIDLGDFKHVNIPFDQKVLNEDYHLVIISMPETPVVAPITQLNSQYCYVTDTTVEHSYKKAYLEADFLENYVRRTHAVIEDLKKQSWGSVGAIHLVGHSQGAKIAAVTAAENEDVASVALLGFNAFGRFDDLIRRARLSLKSGAITSEEYRAKLNDHYQRWQGIVENPDNAGNGNKAWRSFSISYIPYLLQIDAPIWIGYGTEDVGAENCDLLPLTFIEHKKENYHLQPYVGRDHNFFEVDNREAGHHWNEVMVDILQWIEE